MGNSLLAVRGINHKYIVVEKEGEDSDTPEKPEDNWMDKEGTIEVIEVNYGTHLIDYVVRLYDDGTCALSYIYGRWNTSTLKELEIPSYLYYKGRAYVVRYINGVGSGRKYQISVQHLIIPDTVEKIRLIDYIFAARKITFTGKRETIDEGIFAEYRWLENVELPDGLKKIEELAFYDCTRLETLIVPDSVTTIEPRAFENCRNLKKVVLPQSMTTISDFTFNDCRSLTDITWPDNLEIIGKRAFGNCNSLEKIILPEHVRKLEGSAFAGCNLVNTIYLPDTVTEAHGDFAGCEGNGNGVAITIGPNVKIPDLGLYDAAVKSVHLTEGRTEIEEGAFKDCINLKTINIPDSLKYIRDNAFVSCQNDLEEIHLPDGLLEIGNNAFENCLRLKTINIPDSVTTIRDSVFKGCESLKELHLPDGLLEIGNNTFENCVNLKTINIPGSVSIIRDRAFKGCGNIEELYLPDSLLEIGHNVLEDCVLLDKLVISDSMEYCGYNILKGCTRLSKAVIIEKGRSAAWTRFFIEDESPHLIIYGLSGSLAENEFSRDGRFVALEKIDEEGHGYVTDHVITPSTCSTPGEYVLKCVICENCGKTCTAEMPLSDEHEKIEKTSLVQASIGSPGKTAGSYCKACGKTVEEGETIPAIKTVTLSKTSYTYNGKVQKPTVTVKDSAGNKLFKEAYSVTYASGCTNAGTYNVKVNFKGNYKGSKSLSYKITPASRKITVKTSAKTYAYTTAKAQTFSIGASAKTPVSYKSSNTKYVTVDKNGKVTVKKGSPWGTYTVTATAAKSENYNGAAKTITIKINPLTQSVKAKVSSKTYKYAAVKKGKQTFNIGASAKTTLSYSSSNTKYVTVSKKGAVTVKKGTPRGTYKLTVKAAKSAGYAEAKKVITIKIS